MRSKPALLVSCLVLGCAAGADSGSRAPDGEHAHSGGPHGESSDHQAHGPNAEHKHGDGMPHRFEDAEAWAKQFDSPERTAWQKPDEVVAALQLAPDAKVADLGAGTGYFSIRIAQVIPQGHVFAGDIEPDMVDYVTQRAAKEQLGNVTAVLGQPNDASLPEPVDLIFVCNVYHHIGDRQAYFTKLKASLTDGGRLVIVDFKLDAPDDAPGPPKAHRISAKQVQDELASAGYEQAKLDDQLLPYQYIAEFTAK